MTNDFDYPVAHITFSTTNPSLALGTVQIELLNNTATWALSNSNTLQIEPSIEQGPSPILPISSLSLGETEFTITQDTAPLNANERNEVSSFMLVIPVKPNDGANFSIRASIVNYDTTQVFCQVIANTSLPPSKNYPLTNGDTVQINIPQ